MVFSNTLKVRYPEMKSEALDCILLMQVGVFMQVMDEYAKKLSHVTGLKLKMAGDVESPVVMGGFPKSGLDQYVGKLVTPVIEARNCWLCGMNLESFKLLARICHESGGFANIRSYLHVAEKICGFIQTK